MFVAELCDVEKSYARKGSERFYALNKFNLHVKKGQVFCLLGPNGSGKTTTINLINGLSEPTKGTVRVFGSDPVKEMQEVRRKLSVVTQETALYNDLTARENLLFHAQYYGVGKNLWQSRIATVLELVGLTDRQHDRVGTFSGGMQRRLSLARALLTSPELVLLDEPTLGVDVQSRNSIWNRIKELTAEGKTVFLTTNYMEEADALADEIVILDKGQMVTSGTPQSLKDTIHNNKLILHFERTEDVKATADKMGSRFPFELTGQSITVSLREKKQALELLYSLENGTNGFTGFELREPTLNDVFLHFTGKQLRN